jgi:membrane-bound serine protease (ClpP class)
MFSRRVRVCDARRKPLIFSLLLPVVIAALIAIFTFTMTTRSADAASVVSSHLDVMVLNMEIDPASLRYLTSSIATAESDGAQALVIEIDTPGGDLDSMKAMVQAELSSTVPVISYVSPVGGRAASAGAFVTLAAQIATMAPTTRIGASSPVDSTGADIGNTLKQKIENDLVESLRGIQQRYQRDFPDAELMVTQAASYTSTTAINDHIVDLGAANLGDLLRQVDGRSVTLENGHTVTLQTSGASIQMLNQSVADSLYGFLIDPNVVFLLFIVAMIGIYLEISHPGAILPGTVGGIALLLFLLGAGSLSPDWIGLGLMVLSFVFLVLDLRLPTHGVLTVGAVIALVTGALLFFNSGGPYSGPGVNLWVVLSMAGVIALISFALITAIVRAQRRPVTTGVEGMIGAKATALTPLVPEGRVSYGGENWSATLVDAASLDAGAEVQIVNVEGLRLFVRPLRSLSHVETPVIPKIE